MSLAGMFAVNRVPFMKPVVRSAPFHFIIDVLTKFAPLMVSVKAAEPAIAEAGLRPVMAGTGLVIAKLYTLDVPPPGGGFTTVMLAVPPAWISGNRIAAVNWVLLINVVVRSDPFHYPFHWTVDVLRKLEPFMVSVNAAPPAVALVGLRLEIAGTTLPIEKASGTDVPPPGVRFETVT